MCMSMGSALGRFFGMRILLLPVQLARLARMPCLFLDFSMSVLILLRCEHTGAADVQGDAECWLGVQCSLAAVPARSGVWRVGGWAALALHCRQDCLTPSPAMCLASG
jgi:hypothetical protein